MNVLKKMYFVEKNWQYYCYCLILELRIKANYTIELNMYNTYMY